MNIGIDHGYYAIKTRHFSFPAGIAEYQSKYRMVRNLPEKEGCDYADLTKERYEKQAVRQRATCSR